MTYTADNRLATYNGEAIQYDANGNMIYGPLDGQMQHFVYDARNRLIEAGGLSYTYDAEDNRIAVTEDGVTTRFVIDSNAYLSQVLMETDGQGNATAYYVYGQGLVSREEADGNYLAYHFDRRGSTVALTDETGNVTDRYLYSPYGSLLHHQGETVQPFQYNGRHGVMTDSNGLIHMRARNYNSEIKRFVNRDILRGDIRDGQSLNRYAFVNGNPVNYIDPFGLSRDSDVGFGLRAFDTVLDVIPGVGSLKSAIQAGTGYNLVTGERLSVTERGIEALGIIPFFKAGKVATELTTGAIEAANKANKLTKGQADEIAGNPGLLRLDLQYFARDSSKGTGKSVKTSNKLTPDSSATGSHSTFKRDVNGDIYKYETYDNPFIVNGEKKFNPIKRFDGGKMDGTSGAPHKGIPTPHINGKKIPGGVRLPEPWEIPNNPRFSK